MAESDRELCKEFARIGYEVRAVVEDRSVPPGEVRVGWDGPVKVWRYQVGHFRPLSFRAYGDKALKAIFGAPRLASLEGLYRRFVCANADLDLLQVEAPFPEGTLAAIIARRALKPFIVSSRGWENTEFPLIRGRVIQWTLRRATGVRPNATNMAALVVDRFGVDPGRVRVIRTNLSREAYLPPGVSLDTFRQESRAVIRSRTGLSHRFLLVAAARFVPMKGLEHLVAALRILQNRDIPVGVVLCGNGILREQLREQVTELDLAKHVVFEGSVPHAEMRTFLGASDLLVIPALLDWTPRVAVEAAVVGTPSVLTTAVGCASWMQEAGAGRVVPPADPEALADAISGWLEDATEWAEASRNAVDWAETFRVERVAQEMSDFHRDIVAEYCRNH
ncbi:MAG TPA: glycosyltransferase family 4 protein [Candidatus Acidoferrum sp.]|nr:glycosyltransferase family 4 protein [Candidatus Acidoferrum sp.]